MSYNALPFLFDCLWLPLSDEDRFGMIILSASMDEAATKEELRPVKAALVRGVSVFLSRCPSKSSHAHTYLTSPPHLQKKLKNGTDQLPREEKVNVLKDCLSEVGARIEAVVATKLTKGEDAVK